jgi:phosphinothricin acetyltransferase
VAGTEPTHDIRPVRSSDAAAIRAIYAPIVTGTAVSFELEVPSTDEMAARIERVTATDPWLVLERGGNLAGYAYATGFRSRAAYATTRETTVYVHPDHQGCGVGRALMEALLADVARRGTRLAVAVIALPNDASVALHESLGFTRAGTLHGVARKFDAWQDEGFWELRLGEG